MAKLTDLIKRRPVIAFFVLTYALTWTLLYIFQPLYMAGQKMVAPFITLAVFAPSLVGIGLSALLNPRPLSVRRRPALLAFIIAWVLAGGIIFLYYTRYEKMALTTGLVINSILIALLPALFAAFTFSRVPGIRDLLRSFRKPPGSFAWYLLALFLIPALWLLGNLISRAFGAVIPFTRTSTPLLTLLEMVALYFLYGSIFGGLSEETGWRGFALPRLQVRTSPLAAALIIGVLWALWHIPMRFGGMQATSVSDTIVDWILLQFLSIIYVWLYNRTRGSILVTTLIHPAMNTTGTFLNATLGALALLLAFTIFVVVYDKMWRILPAPS